MATQVTEIMKFEKCEFFTFGTLVCNKTLGQITSSEILINVVAAILILSFFTINQNDSKKKIPSNKMVQNLL